MHIDQRVTFITVIFDAVSVEGSKLEVLSRSAKTNIVQTRLNPKWNSVWVQTDAVPSHLNIPVRLLDLGSNYGIEEKNLALIDETLPRILNITHRNLHFLFIVDNPSSRSGRPIFQSLSLMKLRLYGRILLSPGFARQHYSMETYSEQEARIVGRKDGKKVPKRG